MPKFRVEPTPGETAALSLIVDLHVGASQHGDLAVVFHMGEGDEFGILFAASRAW